MKLFITKKKLIKEMAKELAYLEISSDWWYYIASAKEKHDMCKYDLAHIAELKCICKNFGIFDEVYDEACKIYDFSNSGSPDFKPDIPLLRKLYEEFCMPMLKKRKFF